MDDSFKPTLPHHARCRCDELGRQMLSVERCPDTRQNRRWLVQIAPLFRQDIGEFEDVGADEMTIENGCLIFRVRGEVIYARAAGTWVTICPEES